MRSTFRISYPNTSLITIKELNRAGKVIRDSKVLIQGLIYKENVPDTRESLTGRA